MNKNYHLSDVLSVTSGRLVCERHVDGLYDIMGHIFDDDGISTIGLAMMATKAKEFLLQHFPLLTNVEKASLDRGLVAARKRTNRDVVKILEQSVIRLWVDRQATYYGTELSVPQAGGGAPSLTEQIDYVGRDKVIVVETKNG